MMVLHLQVASAVSILELKTQLSSSLVQSFTTGNISDPLLRWRDYAYMQHIASSSQQYLSCTPNNDCMACIRCCLDDTVKRLSIGLFRKVRRYRRYNCRDKCCRSCVLERAQDAGDKTFYPLIAGLGLLRRNPQLMRHLCNDLVVDQLPT